jgi:hypothetical protein
VPGVAAMFWTCPLTLICAPWVQAGMRRRIVHEPLTLPVTVSVLVSLTGYEVDCTTVMPRSVQFRREGAYRLTYSVVSARKYTESMSLVNVSRPVPWQHQNEL